MRRKNNQSKSMLFLLVFVLLVGIGIAYAVLTETLTINNTVSYDAMKWEVGFSKTEDNGGTITSTSSITNEGKSITVNCDFGENTGQETCIVKATITNNGTFDIGLASDPIITYDDTFIHTLTFKWEDHPTYLNSTVLERGFVEKGTSQNVILTIKTKNLTKDMLPEDGISIPVTITLDFKEWWEDDLPEIEDLAILMEVGCTVNFEDITYSCSADSLHSKLSSISRYIKTITFENKIDVTNENIIETLDISALQNGSVLMLVSLNEEKSTNTVPYYDLYIQSDTQIYANENMTLWFSGYYNVDTISGLELLDTSMTTDMTGMFANTRVNSSGITYSLSNLDLSSFDTSNVTNMSGMFYGVGFKSENLELDIGSFDTSNVTNMMGMFYYAGVQSSFVQLDLSNFNTSKVTNMMGMFCYMGALSSYLHLDVKNFDTSKVTNMNGMFALAGVYNPTFTLDVSGFDTSSVTDMSGMFNGTGYSSNQFVTTITVRNPNVVEYGEMFTDTAIKLGSQITVNYTSETSDLVDQMIATKSENSNVVKGIQVD